MIIFSVNEVPELGQLIKAKEGISPDSLGWIRVDDNFMEIRCCDYKMTFTWYDDVNQDSQPLDDDLIHTRVNGANRSVMIEYECDSEELMNTFDCAILKNDFIDFTKLDSSPEKMITILKDSMSEQFASAILSNLICDIFAYSKRFCDSVY